MTGKRFIMLPFEEGNLIFDELKYDFDNEWYDSRLCLKDNEIVDLLNNLHEENKELKKENAQFDILIKNNQLAYIDLEKENEQLKKELRIYRKVASCTNCHYHNYDWYDDGDEFEVCDKGNDVTEGICEEWEEL